MKELDLLDERKLSLEEVRKVCATMSVSVHCFVKMQLTVDCSFGGSVDSYPHPEAEWAEFLSAVDRENAKCASIWNPVTQTVKPWIDIAALILAYKSNGSSGGKVKSNGANGSSMCVIA